VRWVIAALPPLAAAASAGAFPDGAPWEAALQEGCVQCHFDAPPVESSDAISIAGLPERVHAGRRYALTVRLSGGDMAAAGFMLSAWQSTESAGAFTASDGRVATNEAQARSTESGAAVTATGVAEWSLEWTAPKEIDAPILFDLWANAANGDRSPFEDTTHHRRWQIAPAREDSVSASAGIASDEASYANGSCIDLAGGR
jgi:hypothetical protein